MENHIVDIFTEILSNKNCGHLSMLSLSGRLSELSQKDRKHIKHIGGLEKFIKKHPEAFLIDGDEVYVIEDPFAKQSANVTALTTSFNAEDKPAQHSKKSTIDLKSAKDDPCTVCSDPIEIYAIGECRHPICFRCSTKLRVLCGDKNCPVCRRTLDIVVFSKKLLPIDEHNISTYIRDGEYGIAFETQSIQEQKKALLQHVCPKCPNTSFKTFRSLADHAEAKHKLFYCYICVQQCKIFTEERKIFTKQELEKHIEMGDSAGLASGGHPLCEFCNCRYLDNDELLRHLRMHHCSCRICDQVDEEEKNYQFYADKNSLLEHQRENHHPCEHRDCMDLDQIPSFKNEIDLQSHVLQYHSGQKSKMEKRADQRINVPFKFDSKHVKAKRILKTEPDAAGGINITGFIARRIERTYSFIERDDALNKFEENVFFDLEACGLQSNDDLRNEFKSGDRVTAYALPCTNLNAKSRWKAQKVERIEDDNQFLHENSSELTSAKEAIASPPPESSDFPSLATGFHKVSTPALSGWSAKLTKPIPPVVKAPVTHKQTVVRKSDYEIGYIHHNLHDKFGFIQRDKNNDAFEKNIYFHIGSYHPQPGRPMITNLLKELSPGVKVCFVLQKADITFAKTKLRAEKVWKYSEGASNSPPMDTRPRPWMAVKTKEETVPKNKKDIATSITNDSIVVVEDLLVSCSPSPPPPPTPPPLPLKESIASSGAGDSNINTFSPRTSSVGESWPQLSFNSIFEFPHSGMGDFASKPLLFSQQSDLPVCSIIDAGFVNATVGVNSIESTFHSQLDQAIGNNSLKNGTRSSVESSITNYSSDDDDSSEEENSDYDDFMSTNDDDKKFFEFIEVCLQSKPLSKVLKQQLLAEMKKAEVHDLSDLQYLELRREDNSAHSLFHLPNRTANGSELQGYCKLDGFYPVNSSWSGEVKSKRLATKLSKELYLIEGTRHYVTVSKGKGEKTRLMLHYKKSN